jgi:hypothetical protein
MREEPKLVYWGKTFMFNFPYPCKMILHDRGLRHPKRLIPFLVVAGLATPICLVFQSLVYLNFFTVKFKHL